MRILVLSFYYRPDLAAGSFRTTALVEELEAIVPPGVAIDVVTASPNRYGTFARESEELEVDGPVTIRRVPVPAHESGLVDQTKTFLAYARGARRHVHGVKYDLVYATSSRLMTAVLGATLSAGGKVPLYLDIRDIFVDTIKDVFRDRHSATLVPLLSVVERRTILAAARVNLVSPGFESYFRERYPDALFEFFTNGIDDEFVGADWTGGAPRKDRVRVLYAGNVGQGQGLHAVLPELAKATAATHEYTVVGDGGARRLLEAALARDGGAGHVRIAPPVGRDALIGMYRDADVLFLHLNDIPAFDKVLPSKLFEYAATGKPVLAGVAGFAKTFVEREIENARTFRPCDAAGAVAALGALRLEPTNRAAFVAKFGRRAIMRAMAASVLETGGITPVVTARAEGQP